MADATMEDSRLADDIIQKVAQEQAYQDLQDRLKSVEEECRKERAEKDKVKAERDELATTNAQLQEASSSTQSTFATISNNVRDYETRIRMLEREKEELRQDFSQLKQKSRTDTDLVRKYRETSESDGRQIRQLDVERSEAIYAKNKMEHQQKILSSALETVRKESEMYSKALVDKEAEFASYRSSHYMELQQTLSERDREAQLRLQVEKARDQVNRQYQENLDTLNSAQTDSTALQNKLSKKSSEFRTDAAALQKRIDSLENRSKEDREAVEGLEEAFREAQEAHAQRVEAYEDEIQAAAERQAQAEEKMEEMARTVELLSQGVESSSDSWGGLGGEAVGQMAAMIGSGSGSSSGGKTLRQALAEVIRLQAEGGKLKVENERLESLCRSVLRDLEERKPVLDQQRTEYFRMKANADDLARRLAETIQAKEAAEAELVEIKRQLSNNVTESKTLQSQSADLGLQVRVLTREIAIRDDPALAYEAFDPIGKDHPEISDIDAVITNNLTMFKKLPQLLEQNKKLLRISRELGRKLEEKAAGGSSGGEPSDNDLDNAAQAIENLTETVNSLRAQVVDSRTQLELSIKERDMYSRLLVQGRMLGISSDAVDKITSGQTNSDGVQGQDDVVRNVLSGIQAEFEKHRDQLQRQVKEIQDKVEEKTREVEAERERTASALASLRHEQNQNLALTQKMDQEKSDLSTHLSTIAIREAEILSLRTELARVTTEENHLRAQKNHLQTFVDGLNAQKEMLQANELASAESTSKLLQEKAELSREISSRKLVHDQEILVAQNAKEESENALASLREDLEQARNALAEQRTANQTLLTSSKSPELQKRIDELQAEFGTATKERDDKLATLQGEIEAAKADVQTKLNIGLKWQKRTKELMTQINETKEKHAQAVTDLQTEVTSLRSQIENLNGEVSAAKQDAAAKAKQADDSKQEVATLRTYVAEKEAALVQAQVSSITNASTTSAPETAPASTENATAEVQKALDEAKQRISEVESQLSLATKARDDAVAEQTRLQSALQSASSDTAKDTSAEDALRAELETKKAQHSEALRIADARASSAQQEVQRLSQQIRALESELSEVRTKAQTAVQSTPATAPSADVEEPGEIKTDTAVQVNTTAESSEEPHKALDELQAQFDKYKSEQSTKYEQGVMKVNSANVKLKQENQQWRGVRQHIETLQKEFKTPTQGGNFDLNTAIDEIVDVLRTERDKALSTVTEFAAEKDKLEQALEAAKTEAAKVATAAGPNEASSGSADVAGVTKERDELRQQIETLTTQCRAAEEKAAKAAVKASMADKYKKDLTELRAKIASGTTASASSTGPTLSIKGESSATAASTDDAIDLNVGSGTPAASRGARGARGSAARGSTARGATRGATRARGRGAAANGARPLDVQSVLAAVEQGFAAPSGQKRRSSENQGNTAENQDNSKRPKIEQPPGPDTNGNKPPPS